MVFITVEIDQRQPVNRKHEGNVRRGNDVEIRASRRRRSNRNIQIERRMIRLVREDYDDHMNHG